MDIFGVKKLYKLSKLGGGNLDKIQKNSSFFRDAFPLEMTHNQIRAPEPNGRNPSTASDTRRLWIVSRGDNILGWRIQQTNQA